VSFACVAAAAAVAVCGCSSGSSSAKSAPTIATAPAVTGAPASPLPTASQTPLPPASGQLTGTDLEKVLLPAANFPTGFKPGPVVSSGSSLSTAAAQYNLATISCATFDNHVGATGFGETAMAASSYSTSQQVYDQVIYQFASAAKATAFVNGADALAQRCGAGFKVSNDGQTDTWRMHADRITAVPGYPSVEITQLGTLNTSPVKERDVLTASGVDVFLTASVGIGSAAEPSDPALEAITYNLMKRQSAVAVLG
jgi:hypothetical protein